MELKNVYDRRWAKRFAQMKDQYVEIGRLNMMEKHELLCIWYNLRTTFERYCKCVDGLDSLLLEVYAEGAFDDVLPNKDKNEDKDKGEDDGKSGGENEEGKRSKVDEKEAQNDPPLEPPAVTLTRLEQREMESLFPPRSWEERLFEDLIQSLPGSTPLEVYKAGEVPRGMINRSSGADEVLQTQKRPPLSSKRMPPELVKDLEIVEEHHSRVKDQVLGVAEAIARKFVLPVLKLEEKYCEENDVPQARRQQLKENYRGLNDILAHRKRGDNIRFLTNR